MLRALFRRRCSALFPAVLAGLFLTVSSAYSIPSLQLYIDGATYDQATGTWETTASTFDLYVIGVGDLTDVQVSMTLIGMNKLDDPSPVSVLVNGQTFPATSWQFGRIPVDHPGSIWSSELYTFYDGDIYPGWFTEFSAGDFTGIGGVEDTKGPNPLWNPTLGYVGGGQNLGEFKKFTIAATAGYGIHFDAYTYNQDGTITNFAPFTNDASYIVPEPGTFLLLGLGLGAAGIVRRFRRRPV